ncbi:free fatty acid receptor 2-like [Osmerus mordax]|uniref:free fatty acid receptor 2-like n=1 Tax=Osmerus mordax TaxID=8014 RepID=UPI00350F4350
MTTPGVSLVSSGVNPNNSENFSSGVILFVYIITFLIGIPANILAFYTFCCKVCHKPAPIDILLLNLTLSDILFLAFLPFKMKEAMDNQLWNLPLPLCPITEFMFFTTIYTSILFLTGISVERYLSVGHPTVYRKPGRTIYAMVTSVAFWILSVSHCSVVFVMHYSNTSNTANTSQARTKCYEDFSHKQLSVLLPVRLEMFLVLFCFPFIICCFCYISLIHILSMRPKISRRRRLHAIGLALGTLLVFTLCFGPYNVSHIYGFWWKISPPWRVKATLLSTFNACLDPIIFFLSSSDVRSKLMHCLESFRAGLHRHDLDNKPEGS